MAYIEVTCSIGQIYVSDQDVAHPDRLMIGDLFRLIGNANPQDGQSFRFELPSGELYTVGVEISEPDPAELLERGRELMRQARILRGVDKPDSVES
jgi:hypothetical protein